MGEKTDDFLAKHFADSFKREADADETIWRSLPFFLAVLALAVSTLPAAVSGAVEHGHGGWRWPIWGLLSASGASFAIAAYYFSAVIKLRRYRYPPTDLEILQYADQLVAHYDAANLTGDVADAIALADVRRMVLEEFAAAATHNRTNNSAKARARSQVLLFAAMGFLLAFLTEGAILAQQRFGVPGKVAPGGIHDERARISVGSVSRSGGGDQSSKSGQTGAAKTPYGDRGSKRIAIVGTRYEGGGEQVTDKKPEPVRPPKPERPLPVYEKKNGDPVERKTR